MLVATHGFAYYIGKAVATKEYSKNLDNLKIEMDKIKKPVYKAGYGTKPTTSRPKPKPKPEK